MYATIIRIMHKNLFLKAYVRICHYSLGSVTLFPRKSQLASEACKNIGRSECRTDPSVDKEKPPREERRGISLDATCRERRPEKQHAKRSNYNGERPMLTFDPYRCVPYKTAGCAWLCNIILFLAVFREQRVQV